MEPKNFLKGKKVLVVVLGIYGGGAATAKWLFRNGAEVTVTDFRTEKELEGTMKLFTPNERKNIRFVLGGQKEEDFSSHDIIVLGPGVPKESPYLSVAEKAGKQIENDASLFFRFVQNPVIAVTGTRGKSTTTSWLSYLLGKKYGPFLPTGNNPERAFLKELAELKDEKRPVIAEMSSWQLEYLGVSKKAPSIAVITNLFPDHLNRYKDGMKGYAEAKANIFLYQNADDFLVLNDMNEWTPFFLSKKPKAQILYFSQKPLAKGKNGVFLRGGKIIFRLEKKEETLFDSKEFYEKMGSHNMDNLLATLLAVRLFDPKFRVTKKMIDMLPQIRFREEVVYKKNGLMIVNDSASTSPDASIAGIRRFRNCVLITGGTDKDLDFGELAKEIKKSIPQENLILLNGSATRKLIFALGKLGYFKTKKIMLFETLEECFGVAVSALPRKKGTILFSPGSASFEKFRNEFDRGEKFNRIIAGGPL